MIEKIIITGGNGRFATVLKDLKLSKKFLFPNKKQLNILSISSIRHYLKKYNPKYLIHNAALSRPMSIHEKDISNSIDINIIGTCNIVKVCSELNIKLIYFSTGYVYEGTKGNYKENDPVKPFNNYAWSKMGGECAVHMYKNSLILRLTMCERPFTHKQAFYDVNTNFIYHDEVAKIIPKILKLTGILKFMLNIVYKMISKKKEKTEDDIEFLKGFDEPQDYVDKKHVMDLLSEVKGAN